MERKITESEVSQKIDLSDILGREPSLSELNEFAEIAREEIISRTQNGEDRNGREFKPYSKDYAEFKGVSRGDVDLTLFGDMLDSISTSISGSSVTLSIDGEEAVKAFAHITGFEGHPTIKNAPKRDFFGLTSKDAESIARQVERITDQPDLLSVLGSANAFQSSVNEDQDISEILASIGLFND